MGKEVKLGLALIGVLFTVFGVLLFRHLNSADQPPAGALSEERVAAEPLTSKGMTAPSHVVATQTPAHASAVEGAQWDKQAQPPEAEPRASFMPAENEPPADPYAAEQEPAPLAASADSEPINRSPFGAGGQSTEEPAATDEPAPRKNPLRRMSAELPLETGEAPAESPAEVPAEAPTDIAPAVPAETDLAPPADEPQDTIAPEQAPAEPEAADIPQEEPVAETPQPRRPIARDDWQPQTPVEPAEPAPLPVENGRYTVQPGDTLWSISEKVYGTGGYFKAIAAHNRSVLPQSDKLTVGGQVAVPATEELEKLYPSLCPKQRKSALVKPKAELAGGMRRTAGGADMYIVSEGDTLFDIARYELGKASRWSEIYDLNKDLLGEDFDYLKPGIELRMPPRETAAAPGRDTRYSR